MGTTAYDERDYTFGQAMLTLRTEISLTQAGLASMLGVSRRAVGEWEAGSSYPKTRHLKELIALGVRSRAFRAGHEVEEIRALWKVACQKVLLDERWLSALLDEPSRPPPPLLHVVPQVVEEDMERGAVEPLPAPRPRVDWEDALAVPIFYGREEELALLSQWIVQEHCRVVSVLGMGGIGKSALSVSTMYQISGHFDVVIFRSLRDAPSCEALLDECLQVLSPQPYSDQPASLEQRICLLLEHLRKARTLVVLDNLESLLEAKDARGHFRPGFEGYGQLLCRVAEISHQSCLLITSREKVVDLRPLESKHSPVRSLRLSGLDDAACKQLFVEKEVVGTEAEQGRLIEAYSGNPLALKIVAETIFDLFGGEIGLFLGSETLVFGSIADLLGEQFVRLSALEQSVLCWLVIAREPMTLDELLELLVSPLSRIQVLEAVDGLRRRSLIERGKRAGSFTLQSVVLEYVTAFLVAEGSREIQQHRLDLLIQYGLSLAHAKEYVRQTQERLLLSPILVHLQMAYPRQAGVEGQLLSLLNQLREQADSAQGYGPANLIALLRLLRGNLNGLDLSQLSIRGAYLQGTEMQNAKLSRALIRDSVFTQAASATWIVTISLDGKRWATGDLQGQVCIWEGVRSQTLRLIWHAHTDAVQALAFSPDGRTLASGSTDGTVKLWDVGAIPCGRPHEAGSCGALLWTGWQSSPLSLAFSPDGRLLASGGMDATVRFWDSRSGMNLQTLTHSSHVFAVAFSPDGSLLASGCVDGEIRLWERRKGTALAFAPLLSMRSNWVMSLAFAPDGRTLASTSMRDQTVKLWEVGSHGAGPRGQLLHTLPGHADQSRCIAWSPDGGTLAYSSSDLAIWLWDIEQGRCRAVLHGHSADIYGMAFTPEGTRLLSGSADGTLRMWDVENCRCVRLIAGYAVSLWNLDWSPDGRHLISGRTDGLVTIWDLSGGMPPRILRGHSWIVSGVGWSPDGRYFSSCGLDGALCLWDSTSHGSRQRFEYPEVLLLSMAWSPNGCLLACGTYQRGIQVWDVTTCSLRFVGQAHLTSFHCLAWSPNGTQLVGGGDDGCVYLWEGADGVTGQEPRTVPTKLSGHQNRIRCVGWSPDGKRLASGGGSGGSGELFVWDVESGERVQTFTEHPGMVYALAWSRSHRACPRGDQLISGGSDGLLRWWDVKTGECVNIQESHHGTIRSLKVSPDGKFLASCGSDGAIRIWDLTSHKHLQTLRHDRPYERLNITGIRGLNEAEIASLQALGAISEAAPSL